MVAATSDATVTIKVTNLLKEEGFYINSINKDLANKDRCIVCTKI